MSPQSRLGVQVGKLHFNSHKVHGCVIHFKVNPTLHVHPSLQLTMSDKATQLFELQGVLWRTLQKLLLIKLAKRLPMTWDMRQNYDGIGTFLC